MAKVDFSDLPLFLQPRLRLFLSVDLVGSTALKQSSRLPLPSPESGFAESGGGPHWLAPISDFYLEFAEIFETSWRQHCEKTELSTGEAPSLWKANGDELIYVKDLSNRVELYPYFWLDTMSEDRLVRAEAELIDETKSPPTDAVRHFCEAFYESNRVSVIAPFLIDDDYRYTEIPDKYFETLQFWKGKLLAETEKYKKENEPAPANVAESEGGENLDASKFKLLTQKLKRPRGPTNRRSAKKPKKKSPRG